MLRAKNRFYRLLKLDKKSKEIIKFYRQIKEQMLKDVDNIKSKKEDK